MYESVRERGEKRHRNTFHVHKKHPKRKFRSFVVYTKPPRAVNLIPQSCFRLKIFRRQQKPNLLVFHFVIFSLHMPSRNYSYEDINRFFVRLFPAILPAPARICNFKATSTRAEIILYGNCFCFFNISISNFASLIIRNILSLALMTQQPCCQSEVSRKF